jgi:hypothetical protein
MDDQVLVAVIDPIDDLLVVMPGHGFLKAMRRLTLCESAQRFAIDELTDKLRVE